MKVSLTDAGKRFNRDWIFRQIHYTFETGNCYAITGPNGSGKTTLLQILSGAMQLTEGKIQFHAGGSHADQDREAVSGEEIYRHVSICAPYLEVVEEMTVREFLEFHSRFKPFLPSLTINDIVAVVGLKEAIHKQIRYYSSGMKQRVKLAQAIFSDTVFLLLDEPCTNLDAEGIELYNRLVDEYCRNRLVVVSSNDETEYSFCKEKINITDYKHYHSI